MTLRETTPISCMGHGGLQRVQQLTGPRFCATVLDRPAVGHAPAKGLGHFWWIKFYCRSTQAAGHVTSCLQ